jgi:hypothetical protein
MNPPSRLPSWAASFALALLPAASSPAAPVRVAAGARDGDVPAEVQALAGHYHGEWQMFGIDGKGQVVEGYRWTDTVEATRPRVEGDRALVSTTCTMKLPGGGSRTLDGEEGYFLHADGSLGDYFLVMAGKTVHMPKLVDRVFCYSLDADPGEFHALGFPSDVHGTNVMVKVVVDEGGVETHRLTRVTTLQWKEADGTPRTLQFTSLKGWHRHE